MDFNIYNILILFGVFQGFLFSVFLLFKKNIKSQLNNFLAYTVLALSVSNLQYFLLDIGLGERIAILNTLRIPTEFLILPMFYFFVCNYLSFNVSKKKKILILLPFVASFLGHFFLTLFINIGWIIPRNILYTHAIIDEFVVITLSIVLIIEIILKLKAYNKNYDISRTSNTLWIKRLLIIGFCLCIFWILEYLVFNFFAKAGIKGFYPLWISITILIYWIAYESFTYGQLKRQRDIIKLKIKTDAFVNDSSKSNTLNFRKILKDEESFLNPMFGLEDFAKRLNYSPNHLSKLIKENTNGSFVDLMNELKVNKAKELLTRKDFNQYTVVAIGLESGFNSKSSFYSVFKSLTGESPSEFKKGVQKNTKS